MASAGSKLEDKEHASGDLPTEQTVGTIITEYLS